MPNPAFTPASLTKTVAATTASGSVTFGTTAIALSQVQVFNEGAQTAFIAFGSGSATAIVSTSSVDGSTPIGAGQTMLFTKGLADTAAAIYGTGTGNVYFTPGEGQ